MKNKTSPAFLQELRRDLATLRSLTGIKKLEFIWDYYRWRIAGCALIFLTVCIFAHMLWEGQKPCRLRVCAVLNSEESCRPWFDAFTEMLTADGKQGSVDVNLDQPFDYDNRYYYLHEIEVMTTISSGRMDLAVCNADMYSYLLALNACLPLDAALSPDLVSLLRERGILVRDTANLTLDENGNVSPEDGIDGYFAVDLTGSSFADTYDRTKNGREPLYAVIISNTEHLADCETLLAALAEL